MQQSTQDNAAILLPHHQSRETTSRIRWNTLARIGWVLAFAALVIIGFLLASRGYRHGLPVVDLEDEKTIWTMGRAYMDPSWILYQPHYPPGILIVSSLIQRLQIAFGDPWVNVAVTIEIMRLTSVMMFTVTLALIMLLAYRLVGPIAAIAGGLFWLVLPIANYQAKFATVDCWLSAWFMASMLTAVEAWKRQSRGWLIASLLLSMIATIFKYQAAAALVMSGLACLTFWNVNRKWAIQMMVVYGMIAGIFSYWLIFVHRALDDNLYLPYQQTYRPTWEFVTGNLNYSLTQVGPSLIFGALPIIGLVLAFILRDKRQQLINTMGYWAFPVVIVVFAIILSFNGAPVMIRHYLAIMALLAAMGGVGFALLYQLIDKLARRIKWAWSPLLTVPLLALAIVPSWNLMLQSTLDSDAEMLRPDRRAILSDWARSTTTEGGMAFTDPNVAISVQVVYGYRGRTIDTPYNEGTFMWPHDITQAMLDAKNIRYIIANPDYQNPKITAPLTKLLAFDEDPRYRSPIWAAYYVGKLPPTFSPDQYVTFGNEVQLRGYSLSQNAMCPGETVQMQLLWGALNKPTQNYSLYVHLSGDMTGEISYPINGGDLAKSTRPTSSWIYPSELLVGPPLEWIVPPDLPPGNYYLWLGVYEPLSNERLTLTSGADHHVLALVKITRCF